MGKHSEYEIQVFRVLDLLQNEREGRRGRADRQPEVAQRKQGLGAPCSRWRRGGRERRGVDPAAAVGGAGLGGLRQSTGTDRRRGWRRRMSWRRSFPSAEHSPRSVGFWEGFLAAAKLGYRAPGPPFLYKALATGAHQPFWAGRP